MGIVFRCKSCKEEAIVSLGMNYFFPMTYKHLMEDAKKGVYGATHVDLLNDETYLAIDAEKYLFHCPACGYWEQSPDMSIYEPNDPSFVEQLGTEEDPRGPAYVSSSDLEEDYHLVFRQDHICKDCGAGMTKEDDLGKIKTLKCHACGDVMEDVGAIMVD